MNNIQILSIKKQKQRKNKIVKNVTISFDDFLNLDYVKQLKNRYKNAESFCIKFKDESDEKQNLIYDKPIVDKLIEASKILNPHNKTKVIIESKKYINSYPLQKVVEANNKLIAWADKINSLKVETAEGVRALSPLEKFIATIMWLYYKLPEYKEEGKKRKSIVSRGIIDALTSDSIVCVGYSNVLCAMLQKEGIPAIEQSVQTKTEDNVVRDCHSVVNAYIKDEIYDINSVGLCDLTYVNFDELGYLYIFTPHNIKNEIYLIDNEIITGYNQDENFYIYDCDRAKFVSQLDLPKEYDDVLKKYVAGGKYCNLVCFYDDGNGENSTVKNNLMPTYKMFSDILFGFDIQNNNAIKKRNIKYGRIASEYYEFSDYEQFKQEIFRLKQQVEDKNMYISQQDLVEEVAYLMDELHGFKPYFNDILSMLPCADIDFKTYKEATKNVLKAFGKTELYATNKAEELKDSTIEWIASCYDYQDYPNCKSSLVKEALKQQAEEELLSDLQNGVMDLHEVLISLSRDLENSKKEGKTTKTLNLKHRNEHYDTKKECIQNIKELLDLALMLYGKDGANKKIAEMDEQDRNLLKKYVKQFDILNQNSFLSEANQF